jgi:ABC-type ATPase involved in cell division
VVRTPDRDHHHAKGRRQKAEGRKQKAEVLRSSIISAFCLLLSAFDAEVIMSLLQRLNDAGNTIVLITHAASIRSKRCVMNEDHE